MIPQDTKMGCNQGPEGPTWCLHTQRLKRESIYNMLVATLLNIYGSRVLFKKHNTKLTNVTVQSEPYFFD